MTPKRAKIIAFEGIDGCGKTIISNKVSHSLKIQGYKVKFVKENSIDSFTIDLWKDIESSPAFGFGDAFIELSFILAIRRYAYKNHWKYWLYTTDFIIFDRFIPSTLVYQKDTLPQKELYNLNYRVVEGNVPDLTFIIDIDEKTSFERLLNRGLGLVDRIFLPRCKELRGSYLELARSNPKEYVVLDGSKNLEELSYIATQEILRRFK